MSDEARAPTPSEAAPGLRQSLTQDLPSTLLWCLGIAVTLTLILVSFVDGDGYVWFQGLLVNLIISLSIGLSIHTLYRWALPRLLKRFPGRLSYWTSHLVLLFLAVGIGVEIALQVIQRLGGPSASAMRDDVMRIGLVISFIVVAILIVFDRLRQHARNVELRAEQAQREALRSQLAALQARTNPHFLFNSLNTVAGLIEEDPVTAERALVKMSRLFRYSLDGSRTAWVRLGAELAVVRDYLEIEALRLGDRLHFSVDVVDGVADCLVPPLILQPLVENAVLHAVAPRREGGRVEVSARRDGARLELSVTDDGPGIGKSDHRGTGTSLDDLRRRLEMVYNQRASLTTESVGGQGCRVCLELPIEGAE